MKKNTIVFIIALLLISVSFTSVVNAEVKKDIQKKDFLNNLKNLKQSMQETYLFLMQYAKNYNASKPQILWNPSEFTENTREIMNLALILFGHNPIGLLMGALCITIACWVPFRLISIAETHNEFCNIIDNELSLWCKQLIHDLGIFGFILCLCFAVPLAFPLYFTVIAINGRWYTIDAIMWCIQDAVTYCS